jgi:hypothetical protein
MLRRLTLGFAAVTAAVAVVACSSSDTKPISIGPNFPSTSLYATNSSQNGVSIYPPGTASGSLPTNNIGGPSTGLTGPQYLAFDPQSNLWVTNYSSTGGSIVAIAKLATGNVIPLLNSVNVGVAPARPRGLAFGSETLSTGSFTYLVVANVNPAAGANSNELLFFAPSTQFFGASYQSIAGSNTLLNVPSGVAADAKSHVYVANLQGASVAQFTLPTPSPTPTATATPTPTPVPSPSASPTTTPSPTPVPTSTPINIAPSLYISGATTQIGQPTGVALDANANIYVSDQSSTVCGATRCGAVLVFAPTATGNVAPIRTIAGTNTKLFAPTDVKIDSTGLIYVADSTPAGAGVIYVFAATASGNVAPTTTFQSPGTVIGIGLTP